MREIKFRAWCESDKQMKYPEGITSGDILNTFVNVMQYTGLHDKNGKEIYEGDILLTDETYHDYQDGIAINSLPEGQFVEVRWQESAFWVRDELLYEFAPNWEVVGNIYENPELLEKANG